MNSDTSRSATAFDARIQRSRSACDTHAARQRPPSRVACEQRVRFKHGGRRDYQGIGQPQVAMPAAEACGFDSHFLSDVDDAQLEFVYPLAGFLQLARPTGRNEGFGQGGSRDCKVVSCHPLEPAAGSCVECIGGIEESDYDTGVDDDQRHSLRRRSKSPRLQTPGKEPAVSAMTSRLRAARSRSSVSTILPSSASTLS